MRLLKMGQERMPRDREGFARVRQLWEKPVLSEDERAELLARLTQFASDQQWSLETAQRVGSGAGLEPTALLGLLRDRQGGAEEGTRR